MINDKREKNDKEKITIKFLRSNNNYNYMINDVRRRNKNLNIKYYLIIFKKKTPKQGPHSNSL